MERNCIKVYRKKYKVLSSENVMGRVDLSLRGVGYQTCIKSCLGEASLDI